MRRSLILFFLLGFFAPFARAQSPEIDSLQKVISNRNAPPAARKEAMQRWKILINESNQRLVEGRSQQKLLRQTEKYLSWAEAQQDSLVGALAWLIDSDSTATLSEKEQAINLLSKMKSREAYRFLLGHFSLDIPHSTDEDDFRFRDATSFWHLRQEAKDNWLLLPELTNFIQETRNEEELEFTSILFEKVFQDTGLLLGYLKTLQGDQESELNRNCAALIQLVRARQ